MTYDVLCIMYYVLPRTEYGIRYTEATKATIRNTEYGVRNKSLGLLWLYLVKLQI